MVDADRVSALLRRIGVDLAYLRARSTEDRDELRHDDEWLSGLKYRFVTAIEGLTNVVQHLAADQGWATPESNADSVRLLGRHGVLHPELAARLAAAVGFRNVLVRQYTDVDDDQVVTYLDHLDDLDAFTVEVAGWLLSPAAR